MNIQNFYNNFMFTALQEFSEAKTSFFDYKRPVTKFLSKIPFFFTTIACVKVCICIVKEFKRKTLNTCLSNHRRPSMATPLRPLMHGPMLATNTRQSA